MEDKYIGELLGYLRKMIVANKKPGGKRKCKMYRRGRVVQSDVKIVKKEDKIPLESIFALYGTLKDANSKYAKTAARLYRLAGGRLDKV